MINGNGGRLLVDKGGNIVRRLLCPREDSLASALCAVSGWMRPTSISRVEVVELLQMVSTVEVEKARAMVRRKFCRPAAEAVSDGSPRPARSGGRDEEERHGDALGHEGDRDVRKPALLAKPVRQSATRPSPPTPKVTRARASKRCISRGTIGERITAHSALPAR